MRDWRGHFNSSLFIGEDMVFYNIHNFKAVTLPSTGTGFGSKCSLVFETQVIYLHASLAPALQWERRARVLTAQHGSVYA